MNIKLLIVEAGGFFRQRLDSRFQQEGFRIFFADRLADAKKILARKKIDVALLDLSGLKTEGLRILETIKGASASTEVITINNADQLALSIDGMKLGAFDDFLAPVDVQALIDRIKSAAGRKKKTERSMRSFFQKYQDAMAAAAFAEAGEAEEAKNFLENRARRRKKQKGERDGDPKRKERQG